MAYERLPFKISSNCSTTESDHGVFVVAHDSGITVGYAIHNLHGPAWWSHDGECIAFYIDGTSVTLEEWATKTNAPDDVVVEFKLGYKVKETRPFKHIPSSNPCMEIVLPRNEGV